jgi:hypothetical protein
MPMPACIKCTCNVVGPDPYVCCHHGIKGWSIVSVSNLIPIFDDVPSSWEWNRIPPPKQYISAVPPYRWMRCHHGSIHSKLLPQST